MTAVGPLQVAGQQSGLAVVDKAQSAVNTVKIINALNEISDILKACTLHIVTPHMPILHFNMQLQPMSMDKLQTYT